MIPANSGTLQPDAIEYDPIPLKPKPPTPHAPHPTPTTPMAPAPDTVTDPVPTGLAAAPCSVTFVLSPGQTVSPNTIKAGTKVNRLDKVKADGTLKLTAVGNATITVTAATDPNTYQIQISTTDASLHGKAVFVVVVLSALKKAGAASGQFT